MHPISPSNPHPPTSPCNTEQRDVYLVPTVAAVLDKPWAPRPPDTVGGHVASNQAEGRSSTARLVKMKVAGVFPEVYDHSTAAKDVGPLAPIFSEIKGRGVVDTLRLRIRAHLDERDAEHLAKVCEKLDVGLPRTFRGVTVGGLVTYHLGGGARVLVYSKHIAVEFSVPRLLKGCNSRVAEVSPAELRRLVRDQTAGLLPRTTARARRRGSCWGITRIDLAVDFHGWVERVLRTYLLAKTKSVRSDAVLKGKKHLTLYWQPKGRRASQANVLYDKVAEMASRPEHLRGRAAVMEPTGRFEVRLRVARSRVKLTRYLVRCPEGEGLPFAVGDGAPPAWYRVDYALMHAFLHNEAVLLEGRPRPPRRGAPWVDRQKIVCDIARWPVALRRAKNPRDRELLRRDAFALALERLGTRLSWLCWPGMGDAQPIKMRA